MALARLLVFGAAVVVPAVAVRSAVHRVPPTAHATRSHPVTCCALPEDSADRNRTRQTFKPTVGPVFGRQLEIGSLAPTREASVSSSLSQVWSTSSACGRLNQLQRLLLRRRPPSWSRAPSPAL